MTSSPDDPTRLEGHPRAANYGPVIHLPDAYQECERCGVADHGTCPGHCEECDQAPRGTCSDHLAQGWEDAAIEVERGRWEAGE